MDALQRKAWASAKATEHFIDLHAYSGYRSSVIDSEGKNFDLPVSVSDEELGRALLDTLASSRFLDVGGVYALNVEAQANYEAWVAKKMALHGYKSRRALFKNMKTCTIESQDGEITIVPWHHDKLEGWSGRGIMPDDYVRISAERPPAEIGAALKLAFSRCRGAGVP